MIIEMQDGIFINDYGYKEKYTRKQIDKELTGHMNLNSPFSLSDDCGNCDGALCHRCRPMYRVTSYDIPRYNEKYGCDELVKIVSKIFFDEQEALEFYKSL